MVERTSKLSKEEKKAILAEIREKADQLIDEEDLPIAYFRIVHSRCRTREEPAGMLTNILDHFEITGDWAYREICLFHKVSSMRFAKR